MVKLRLKAVIKHGLSKCCNDILTNQGPSGTNSNSGKER